MHDVAQGAASVARERQPWHVPELPADRRQFLFRWPDQHAMSDPAWTTSRDGTRRMRKMPERAAALLADSRWPAFFPCSMCVVTTSHDGEQAIEKVVGASIVNRFPYVVALSFCRLQLSARHYRRSTFMELLERSGCATIQFLVPGAGLANTLQAIASVQENQPDARLRATAQRCRPMRGGAAPVLEDAYLVYQARLVRPSRDFEGKPIYDQPWTDHGSHRIYYLEISTIGLREDIAAAETQLHWRSLPVWQRLDENETRGHSLRKMSTSNRESLTRARYTKTYRPDYVFPSRDTVGFEATGTEDGFAWLDVPPLAEDPVEVDNDRARWPCFFPSSLGLITVTTPSGARNAFPCGSTTVLVRQPLTIGICVSYAQINIRYAPRASLEFIREAGHFGCGVPVYRPDVIDAITYLGNLSLRDEPEKVVKSGLTPVQFKQSFGFDELPIHFECRVVGEMKLGTHTLFLGRVEEVQVRTDLTPATPLEWCAWAGLMPP
jgi:flavin reductase (DIM6/NTAB) family NADH-FMN oxidoreductase RutF